MPKDNGSNDFFKHLEQPAPAPQARKLRAPGAPTKQITQGTGRPTDKQRAPGLSPGIPVIERPESGEVPAQRPRSGVVLTPGGVKRTDAAPPPPPPIPEEEAPAPSGEFSEGEEKATDAEHVG